MMGTAIYQARSSSTSYDDRWHGKVCQREGDVAWYEAINEACRTRLGGRAIKHQ